MNYYPFHIGDYIAATRHLSWDEDAAYRRLLDWCYANEKPLPLDEDRVCRLVVATSDAQRHAVTSVLSEFFVRTDEGWRHTRVDEELAAMQEKKEAVEERDEHEKTRQQKHRERRAALFATLAEVGIFPAWNAKTGELEKLIAETAGVTGASPETKPVTPGVTGEQVNRPAGVTGAVTGAVTGTAVLGVESGQPVTQVFPMGDGTCYGTCDAPVTPPAVAGALAATAIPTPTPTPTPKEEIHGGSADAEATAPKTVSIRALVAEGVDRQKASDWLVLRKAKRLPLTVTAWDDTKAQGAKVGLTPAQTVEYAVSSNWAGFKASWYEKEHPGGAAQKTGQIGAFV